MDEEIYVEINGFPDYEISNYGNVKSLKGKKPLIMSCVASGHGYRTVKLRKDGKYHTFTVHRLVALHFIENYNDYNVINHKDGNKLNNNVYNLEWVTMRENNQHAYDTGLKKITQKMREVVTKRNIEGRKPVVKIDPETNEIIKEYSSVNIAAENENICAGDISKCCKGYRIKTLKGYKYRYKGHEDVEYTGRYKKK